MSHDPKQILEQCKQQCEQMKSQMTNSMSSIQNPQAKTAYQMAINAVDSCIAQCHTAGGTLQ